MKEALFYRSLDEGRVSCFLCEQRCVIHPGKRGKCGVRENREGTLWSLVYGKLLARNIDPIEKKPLFHFQPGTRSYSIATAGCNFRCLFCQNSDISQAPHESKMLFGYDTPVEEVVLSAKHAGCASISYTYTEPTIFMEYAMDTARAARSHGLKNVFVTNGFMTAEALDEVAPWLDAANVDLKAFTDDFYSRQCGARLQPVLDTLQRMKKLGIWLEVTTLIIPGLNDDPSELRSLAEFVTSLGPNTPWHVSRFHPTYRLLDRPSTPARTLQTAREIGLKAGLRYVYTGNIPGDEGESTYCHACRNLLIERFGFSIAVRGLRNGTCTLCGAPASGIGLP
ncbi:MAG: AmmeMemoRadiSam system radical SAM enzyme [Syntrophobacteraceae bacterium]